MTKKKSLEVAGKVNQQLLDTSTDFNNFSNLSYFISEYKKARQIIRQCQSFYENFLRNKVYTLSDILKLPNIVYLDYQFQIDDYYKNCDDLANHLISLFIHDELEKKSKKYKLEFKQYSSKFNNEHPEGRYTNQWEYTISKSALVQDRRIFEHYLNNLFSNEGKFSKLDDNDDENYTVKQRTYYRSDIPDNYYFENQVEIKDTKYKNNPESCKDICYIQLYNKEYKEDPKTKKYRNFFTPIDGKEGQLPVVDFSKDELEVIKILKRAYHLYGNLSNDIKVHPKKYLKEWNDYLKFRKDNYILQWYDPLSLKRYEHFGAIGFTFEQYGKCDHFIDALDFLRYEYIEADLSKHDRIYHYDEEDYLDSEYEDEDGISHKVLKPEVLDRKLKYKQLNSHISNKFYIDQTQVNLYVKEHFSDEFDEELQRNRFKNIFVDKEPSWRSNKSGDIWYYVLYDNIPLTFCTNLSDVEINFNEELNILECYYCRKTRRKKAAWPGWLPWIVTTSSYTVNFDCTTNELIYYNQCSSSVEESSE